MDSRINSITNLKDYISSRNSVVTVNNQMNCQELPSPQEVEYGVLRKQIQ